MNKNKHKNNTTHPVPVVEKKTITIIAIFFCVLTLFSTLGFILWTVVPQLQGRNYLKKAGIAYTPDVIINDKFIFAPYTNAQGIIRYFLVADLIEKFARGEMKAPDALFDKTISELEAYTTRFPYYYDYYLLLGKAYEAQADLKKDPALLKTAEAYYQKSLAVAPGRQDVLYASAINLVSQGRSKEALKILKDSVVAYPQITDGHYEVAQVLMVLGTQNYNEALAEFEIALTGGSNLNAALTLQFYQKLFYYYYHNGDIVRLDTSIKRLAILDASQSEAFKNLSDYLEKNHQIPLINIQQTD